MNATTRETPQRPTNGQAPPEPTTWLSPAGLWERRSAIIAALSLVGILSYLIFYYGIHLTEATARMPLFLVLGLGGLPMLWELGKKLLKLEFGSDLLGGISVITALLPLSQSWRIAGPAWNPFQP